MPRPRNPDMIVPWKLHIPATLAGRIEYCLHDKLTGKTKYGSRNRLVVALLERWITEQLTPDADLPRVPSLYELRIN